MTYHPIHAMQMVDDRRAALMTAAQRHRLFRETRPRGRWWGRRSGKDGCSETPESTYAEVKPFAHTRTPIPLPGTDEFREWASTVGPLVASAGIDRAEKQAAELCRIARRHRVSRGCAEIVADRNQPDVARERALGRLLAALAAWAPTQTATSDVA